MRNKDLSGVFMAEGWEDVAGGNDPCDYLLRKDGLQLAICSEDPRDREDEEWARFQLARINDMGEADYDSAAQFEDFRFVLNWISIELYDEFDVQVDVRGLPWTGADEMLRDMSTDDPNHAYVRGWHDRHESLENIYAATWAYRNQLMDDELRREIDARFCAEWERECDARGLRHGSADEVLHELETTDPNRAYVEEFVARWERETAFSRRGGE